MWGIEMFHFIKRKIVTEPNEIRAKHADDIY